MKMENEVKTHGLRPRDIINLAAPSSWAASVLPSVLALVLAYKKTLSLDLPLAVCLFFTAILMQSSVNALNDYMDFIKGTDSLENSPDASDAVIVYGLSPKTARNTGIIFLVLAFAIGSYSVLRCGFVPLVIGLIGALVIVCYSSGKLPISYLPIGELVSGFVMGGLITLAGYYMQTKELDYLVLLKAVPIIMGIGMIMFSNNGCDIEKDIPVGRHTLPCLLGRKKTDILYRVFLIIWLFSPIIVLALLKGFQSVTVYLLEIPIMIFGFTRQMSLVLGQEQRGQVMGGIGNLNIILGFAYMIAILLG